MADLEARRTALSADMERAGGDHEALARLGAELADVAAELETVEERWLELGTELEA